MNKVISLVFNLVFRDFFMFAQWFSVLGSGKRVTCPPILMSAVGLWNIPFRYNFEGGSNVIVITLPNNSNDFSISGWSVIYMKTHSLTLNTSPLNLHYVREEGFPPPKKYELE